MVDSVCTTRYSYNAAGQLLVTSGPFGNDALTNTRSSRWLAMQLSEQVMKKHAVKTVLAAAVSNAFIGLVAMIGVTGCASSREGVSGKSWSQTAAREQQQEELEAAPQGAWIPRP